MHGRAPARGGGKGETGKRARRPGPAARWARARHQTQLGELRLGSHNIWSWLIRLNAAAASQARLNQLTQKKWTCCVRLSNAGVEFWVFASLAECFYPDGDTEGGLLAGHAQHLHLTLCWSCKLASPPPRHDPRTLSA